MTFRLVKVELLIGDAFAAFVNGHCKGPLFGEHVGKSALDLDPSAAKFDAIEKFDSTLGETLCHDVDIANIQVKMHGQIV